MTRHLVTSALPYANGPLHFGHAIGAYLPADVYVRTLRALGEEALFVCGADEHGVSITLGAEREGVGYAEYVARWRDEIKRLFDRLGIEFDVWSGTSVSPHHAELSQDFFRKLHARGFLLEKTEEQLYCPDCERFLADRYVTGTCHECGHPEARGDECPKCGSWLDALRLGDPTCKVCGATPVKRATTHWYLDLPKLRDAGVGDWFREHGWKPNVERFVGAMLDDLLPRPITRDLPWGVPVPPEIAGEETGKVLYVWFDAPIGYASFTREWADAQGDPDAWERWWKDPETRLVHFIGKDNIPFHCLIFPSMLFGVDDGYVLPWAVPANEFYNLQGGKFSTSEGWTIPLDEFFSKYDAEVARFHLLRSAPETSDADWRWEEFQRSTNSELADTIGNLVTRVLRFSHKRFDGAVPALDAAHEAELDAELLGECGPVEDPAEAVLEFRFRRAAERLIANAAVANVFLERTAPWGLVKTDRARAASVISTAAEWIALVARWMVPFLPRKAEEIWTMLGREGRAADRPWPGVPAAGAWRDAREGHSLGEIEPPFAKLDDDAVAAEVQALEERAAARSGGA